MRRDYTHFDVTLKGFTYSVICRKAENEQTIPPLPLLRFAHPFSAWDTLKSGVQNSVPVSREGGREPKCSTAAVASNMCVNTRLARDPRHSCMSCQISNEGLKIVQNALRFLAVIHL